MRSGLLAILLVVAWGVGGVGAQDTATEHLGDWLMRALPATALVTTLMLGDEDGTLDFLLGGGVNVGVTEGLKRAFPKERPDGSDRKSFPSGHTSISFQSASFLHFRYGAEYALPAYAAAAFVGFSRVDGRAHYVEDVVAGLLLGVLSSRIFTERRTQDIHGPGTQIGAGVRLRFGGGLSPKASFGPVGIGR